MKIALASYVSDNRWTGMGKWAHCISDALCARGHHVELLFAQDFPSLRRAGRFARHLYPFAVMWRMVSRRNEFDAVVIHEPGGLIYGLLRRLWPELPPLILMCHNVESHVFFTMSTATEMGLAGVTLRQRLPFQLWHRVQSDGAILFADRVVCLSTRDQHYLTKRLRRRPTDVFFKVNGVEQEIAVAPRSSGERILFVGGWLDIKGRRLLPLIWERLIRKQPNATLTIVGTGLSEEVVLSDFAPQVRSSIQVIPRVESPAAMNEYFCTHDVFLMPSICEGSPLALLEAMAAGMAVVAADVGGIPDIVRTGIEGILFPSGDSAAAAEALFAVLNQPGGGNRMALASLRRAKEFTWDAAAAIVETAVCSAFNSCCKPLSEQK